MRTRQAPTLVGQKILVTIDKWDITSRYPEGHFVRALGKAESKEAEQESLLLEFEVPYRPFGKAILDCLPVEGEKWVVPPKSTTSPEWRDRVDLRDLIICSIDPPNCQDIDDALHARPLPNGNIEAGVRESNLMLLYGAVLNYKQISPTFLISYIPTTQWTVRQHREGRQYIWSTSESTCYHPCLAPTSAR